MRLKFMTFRSPSMEWPPYQIL